MTYNTTGIILKYRDIGEYDRIYSILTYDHGKVDAWAQGVRKPKSKLVAHLQPLYVCDFMFARGRRFDRIAQARVINYFPEIRNDLQKIGQAVYAASLVDTVLRPGARERGVFELIMSFFDILNSTRPSTRTTAPEQGSVLGTASSVLGRPPLNSDTPQGRSPTEASDLRGGERRGYEGGVVTIFSLKLLKESGFAPELRWCVLCKKEVTGISRAFDAIRGGVLCEECFRQAGAEAFLVSSLTLETVESVLASPLAHLEMPEAIVKEISKIVQVMIDAHFGEKPKAGIFMETLAQAQLNIA